MWSILGILIIAIGIILYEVPSLLKRAFKKELWVFSILLTIGVILSIFESLNFEIPNPSDWLTIIYKPITDFMLGVLE